MKALILTMTSGEGHNSIAKVLAETFRARGIESEILDIFKHNEFEYKFNNLGYLFVCSNFPKTYNYFWKKLKFRKSNRRYHGTAQREVNKVANFVRTQVEACNPDFFVCVHPYCAMLCDLWKRQGHFSDKKSFAILTDILPHPLWESAVQCNYVLTPTAHSAEQLKFKGFSEEQIVESGFPVSEKFSQSVDKATLRQQLGLQNKFTVMVASGGFGIGKNWRVVKRLLNCKAQILCVNGRNKKAFAKTQKLIAKHPQANILNFAFVDNFDQLLSASDIAVTRGGAGTVFEAMSAKVPLVIREKTIINERENAEILESVGAAVRLHKLDDLTAVVQDLQCNFDKLELMRQACAKVTNGKCATDVCNKIVELL